MSGMTVDMLALGETVLKPSPTLLQIFLSECAGTAVLILLGCGAGAATNLLRSKSRASDWVCIALGWGLAVYAGVYVAWRTGGHLNPAVTCAKALWHAFDPSVTLNGAPIGEGGIPVTVATVCTYIIAQCVGAFIGAALCWLAYKKQFDLPMEDNHMKLYCFVTSPEIASPLWNVVTEAIGTFVLVAFVMVAGGTPTQVGPLAVALCIVVIVIALGGPTGAALNPARDLAPRVFHALAPFEEKSDSEWSYAWVPVVGPVIGALLAVVVTVALGVAV